MTLGEYKEKLLKDTKAHDAKNQVVTDRENASSEDRTLVTKFYKALQSRDLNKIAEVNKEITADYKAKGQNVGTPGSGTTGGILVPTTVADSIITKMNYISPMRQIAHVIPNMPAQMQLPSENSQVQAYWVAEGAAPTETSEVVDPNLLTPYKAAGLDSFTSEIIADAATNPSIQNFIEQRFSVALALLENAAFVNGDGTGKPYGFRSSAITPVSLTQQGDTLQYTDCTALKFALKTAYRGMAVFVGSSNAIQGLENVRDNYGRPIFRQGLTEGTPDKLLGQPIYTVDEIPMTLGTTSDQTELWFGLFSNYYIGDRGGIRVDYGTNASDFANDKISLRVLKRVAGRPVIGESFAKLVGVK